MVLLIELSIYIFSPLIILACICFCLPFFLFAARVIGVGNRGASEDLIQKLSTRVHETEEGLAPVLLTTALLP
jgi:hypothetical protein